MLVQTRRYGPLETVDVPTARIYEFYPSLGGFEGHHRFAVISEADSPVEWLQSLDDPDVSFAVLEPSADGFRNYLKPGHTRAAEHLLLDRAALLTLTVAFRVFIFKAVLVQPEVLFWTMYLGLFLLMLRMLHKPSWTLAIGSGLLAGILLSLALPACSPYPDNPNDQLLNKENRLTAAGFKKKSIASEAQLADFRSIPAHLIRPATFKGKIIGFGYSINQKLVDQIGQPEVVEGVYAYSPSPAEGSAAYEKVKAAVGSANPDPYTCQVYDHVNLVLLAIAILAIGAPLFASIDPNDTAVLQRLKAPSAESSSPATARFWSQEPIAFASTIPNTTASSTTSPTTSSTWCWRCADSTRGSRWCWRRERRTRPRSGRRWRPPCGRPRRSATGSTGSPRWWTRRPCASCTPTRRSSAARPCTNRSGSSTSRRWPARPRSSRRRWAAKHRPHRRHPPR